MPSRPFSPSISCSPSKTRVFLFTAAVSAFLIILAAITYLVFYLWCSVCNRPRTSPFDSSSLYKLHRFSLRELRSATNGFREANLIGRGGSGTVFHGVLRSGNHIAVKILDATSLEAEREFQNELQILSSITSPFIVSLVGFCVANCSRFLVFEYLQNRSLQESLFCEGTSNLSWSLRFGIVLDVARALAFLHGECNPPVIHGDIKPSNVLLDSNYRARVSDFGLSRLKTEGDIGIGLFSQDLGFNNSQELSGNLEVQCTAADCDFASGVKNQSSSSSPQHKNTNSRNSNCYIVNDPPPSKNDEKENEISVPACRNEGDSCSSAMAGEHSSRNTNQSGKDWWWKQEESTELCNKDYVMEWIGSQICGEEEDDSRDSSHKKSKKLSYAAEEGFQNTAENRGGGGTRNSKKKQRKLKEWWKEEYLAELRKKSCTSKKHPFFKRVMAGEGNRHEQHVMDLTFTEEERKKKKKKKRKTGQSDMWSGDIFSKELSSTTSMKGTLCYVAPEYGGCGCLVEKGDVYSFGVLILVVLSGRRPLHVLSSPMKLERANLINWCRRLAQSGDVLEVIDERLVVGGYDQEKATLCVHLALACLQRSPELRPNMEDVVKILNGELDLPPLLSQSSSPSSKTLKRKQKPNLA